MPEPRRRLFTLLAAVAAVALAATLGAAPRAAGSPATTTVRLDGTDVGRTFDGVGAISASSSLLIHDYPEPQRSQLLDYLFAPHYGAALQILKVEIGGDGNSTTAAEPSHERHRGELNCHRGMEWWLMRQAKARNPDIKLAGLMWTAPNWLSGGLWSADHVTYLTDWLRCAQRNGLHIDYLGGANEEYTPAPQPDFFVALRTALDREFPWVRVVATDEHTPPDYFHTVDDMATDPAYRDAVDVLGEHDVCVWHSLYQHCHTSDAAVATGIPLWNSEQSSQDVAAGAGPLARAMNRDYLDARVTGNINWAMAGGYYGNTDTGGTGLLSAEWPWTGHYEIGPSTWVDAHTTQFTEPGWRYEDDASGYLPGGASYVTLLGPRGAHTTVVETMDQSGPATLRLDVGGSLSRRPMQLWSTDVDSTDPGDWFVHRGRVAPGGTVRLEPGHVYTVSTVTGARKGRAVSPPDTALPVPYRERFERPAGTRAPYFQDVSGGFEAAPCTGRRGTCYRQAVDQQPILWHRGGATPASIVGDPFWYGDYTVRADVRLDRPGGVELLGRIEKYNANGISGYHLRVGDDGWRLYTVDTKAAATTLASGDTAVAPGGWHRVALRMSGDTLTATLDGQKLTTVTDTAHRVGQVGIATTNWQQVEFDDLAVTPTRKWPHAVPARDLTATASAAQPGVVYHHKLTADQAVDGRLETRWQSPFDPAEPLPQSLTVDLGRVREVSGLTYRPPVDAGSTDAIITGYTVESSVDGIHFTRRAAGSWTPELAARQVDWKPARARYVRLTATGSGGYGAAAAEVGILTP